ncbi:MAG: amino acid adenylation domain-containing protein [candidate division KSB1 bacterium]|nr:amino acid adenylation domain-containing protein [candidate division KSB1 bacterium]
MEQCLREIVRRHETLRTTFATVNGQPVQVISPSATISMPKVDLQAIPHEHRLEEAIRLATEEAKTPFNLSTGPLIRVKLIKLGKQDHVVLLNMHHIISDGWSMSVLIQEIAVLYEAFLHHQPSPLPELPIQYADFAQWQQEWLAGERLEQQIAYWKKKLDSNLPILELPTDRTRPAVQTLNGDTYSTKLSKLLSDQVKTFARQQDATLFMTLLAAFKVLLHRYTGQTDICVGSPIANRTRAEIEGLIGFFVNTIVLRTQPDPDLTFSQYLQQVKEITLEAYANQDVPFERLVEILQPDRDMSHSSLFQVMFILQNNPMLVDRELPEVSISTLNINAGTSTFDLTLMFTEQPDGLSASVEYNTDLFNKDTIIRLMEHYRVLLENILRDPNQQIAHLPLISEAEQRKLLEEWNNTEVDFPTQLCIHQLFEQQVERNPDAEAVIFGEQKLSYGELNRKANQMARLLMQHGIGPGKLVGICQEKSLELIVSVLATLKAGAAFLPIDPSYPKDRIDHMLEDAQVSAVLTFEQYQPVLLSQSVQTILLDRIEPLLEKQRVENLTISATPDHLAYVIYTSGSTGKSKGVMVPHRSVVNQYFAWEKQFELGTKATCHLQMASFSFDVFCGDLIRALGSGGKLVLCPRDLMLDVEKLYQTMIKHHVDIAEFVPVVLRNLIQYLEKTNQNLSFLNVLIAGSDVWYVGEYQKFLKFCGPQTRLFNTFGLTEAAIDSTYFEGQTTTLSGDRVVPIGRPFSNTTIYILDSYLNPTPIGVPGELFVGGAGVTYGYLNRPDLTAEKFIPDPFANKLGQRLYRTGDRARYLADGNIEFLGRMDYQVKIRGFRIELGEVEATLGTYPDIQQAAVIVSGSNGQTQRLVAFLVAQNGLQPTASELRAYLKNHLPDYMIPAYFIWLDEMPLSPNGKIDRRALAAYDIDEFIEPRTDFVPPRTATEQIIADIWQSVLGCQRVGCYDHFFELGGHSLLATLVVSRLRETFQTDVPLRLIFESPTVAELAEYFDRSLKSAQGLLPPAIVPVPRNQDLPLSFAQQRLWFLDQFEPNSPFYNIPNAVRLQGELTIPVLRRTVQEIVRRHELLRTVFQVIDGKPHQTILPERNIPVRIVDLTQIPLDQQQAVAFTLSLMESQQPFDLSIGPLLRVTLLRLADHDHIVLVTMHHIISDEWSIQVFTREIAIIYDAFLHGRPSPLPELPIQYADFAYWQQQWLQGEVLERQLNYWKQQLDGIPGLLELPTDRPRPAVQTFRGDYQTFYFSEQLSQAIKAFGQREGVTLFMTLLAGFQALLHRYSGQDDICVGTPIANRTQASTENLIGFFVNTLVLRARFAEGISFRELVQQVKEAALGAYMHQDLPFEKLVDALQPKRDTSHSPLFQVMFALQNTPTGKEQISVGLTASPFETHLGSSKFDMTLFMQEDGNHLAGALEFNTDLFDASTIARFIQHFEMLFTNMLHQPDQAIGSVPILSEIERHRAIVEWNNTKIDYRNSLLLPQWFEAQVARTPDAVAVVFGDHQLTYRQLNHQANQLAHRLERQGIGPEKIVAICMERSLEVMIALFGVLKVGGAYVPIDPSYPKERIDYMLLDSRAALVLSQSRLLDRLPAEFQMASTSQPDMPRIICLDRDWPSIATESEAELSVQIDGDNLAYVIYTSGSTGKPKGVMISHQALMNYLLWCLKHYPITVEQGALVHSSLAFDATITGLYAPLLCGSSVYLTPENEELDIVAQTLAQKPGFGLVKITPAHLQMLGEQINAEMADELVQAFIIGGENLTREHIHFWLENAPYTKLINEYGPTETVVGCMNYLVPSNYRKIGSVPIGSPIGNVQIYLLDSNLEPVPIGVAGEIYIGGAGVARGYLDRPELTAEKFLPDPFSQQPGARFYRTGDLAKYLPNGTIEFLGRIDHQVKIRGFRIELGEIESALAEHPAIREAVVQPWQTDRVQRLVAYLVPKNSELPSSTELREYLKNRLPEYMIPASFVKLANLPLTSNGKVDRKALPEPSDERPVLQNEFVGASTPIEQTLVQIWQQVLGLEKIGIHDNFFELGGDSILTIQVISRARQAGINLTPKQIFQYPTIAGLAELAANELYIHAEQGLVRGPVPLTPIQRWFFELPISERHHWNQHIMLSVGERLNPNWLKKAIDALLHHHDALRMRFYFESDDWYQTNDGMDDPTPFCWIDLSDLSEQDQQKAIESQAAAIQASLNLSQGPLIRFALFDRGADLSARLFIVAHHLIIDFVSWQILLEDFIAAYQQLSQGAAVRLPAKTTSFQYWAIKLAQYAQSSELLQQVAYWEALNTATAHPIPLDFPDGQNTEASGRVITRSLSPEYTQFLLNVMPSAYRTPVMTVLLTSLVLTMRDFSGSDRIMIDLEGHGRESLFDDVDLSRTIGWFTVLSPVAFNLTGVQSPSDAIQAIKQQLNQIPQRGIGFGLLKYLTQQMDGLIAIKSMPQPEIIFNYFGQMSSPNSGLDSFEPAEEIAGFDRSPENLRSHILEINGSVNQGRLYLGWTYSENLHRQETIERMADRFIEHLIALIHHYQSGATLSFSSEDFHDFHWKEEDIQDIIGELSRLEG